MNKKYERVVEVKNVLDTIDTYDVSGIDTAIYSIQKHSVANAIAFAAVLMSGTFYESLIDGWAFQMSSTKCCMESLGYAKYLVTRGKSIPIDLYLYEA